MPGARLVVDTNIFVGALFSIQKERESLNRFLLNEIIRGTGSRRPQLFCSAAILTEYARVFYYPELDFDVLSV